MNCHKCGKPVEEGTEICENCGSNIQRKGIRENVISGTVGALIGAVLGAGCIILLSQLGYIASVSGLILSVCTLKGYELLGGKLSGKGILICVALMLLTPYIADRMDWAIFIMQEWADYGVTFGQAFAVVPELLADGSIEMFAYIKNLLMIYGFALLGAFSTLRSTVKK